MQKGNVLLHADGDDEEPITIRTVPPPLPARAVRPPPVPELAIPKPPPIPPLALLKPPKIPKQARTPAEETPGGRYSEETFGGDGTITISPEGLRERHEIIARRRAPEVEKAKAIIRNRFLPIFTALAIPTTAAVFMLGELMNPSHEPRTGRHLSIEEVLARAKAQTEAALKREKGGEKVEGKPVSNNCADLGKALFIDTRTGAPICVPRVEKQQ